MARDSEPAEPVSNAGVEDPPAPRARTREDGGESVGPDELVSEPGDADEVG